VRLLLESAADATIRNENNQTPYNLANLRGHQQIALLLLEYNQQHGGAAAHFIGSPPVLQGGKIFREHSMSSLDESDDSNFSIDITVSPAKRSGRAASGTQTFDRQQQFTPELKRKLSDEGLPRPHTSSPSLTAITSKPESSSLRSPMLLQQRNPLINSAREVETARYTKS
jgi:ankyrin repeat protein